MNTAIKTFNSWAKNNKDEGMEKNHTFSVNKMLELIPSNKLSSDFSFIDIGCGNGWVVQKMNSNMNCIKSVGIDGAENMIKKAIYKDPNSEYFQYDIEKMDYKHPFDIVFSMEVFYYFKDPVKVLKYVHDHLLKPGGCIVMGVDHYKENKSSLSWNKDLDLTLKTFSIEQWQNNYKHVGFKNIKTYQFGAKENWTGTLVVYCEKSI